LNEPVFTYDDQVIPISEIDATDDTYRLSLGTDPAGLVFAIQAVGLINPPVLRQDDSRAYRIVCGFRRVEACRSLGWPKVHGRVVVGDVSELDLLKLAILDNRSHRPLNVVEQARGIQKLSVHIPAKRRLEVLARLLGFPPNIKVYQKIGRLTRLPQVVQAGLLDETISFEAGADLSCLSPEEALAFFDILQGLKLSQNKQREIIRLVREIAARENLQALQVLREEDIRAILDTPESNRNEKGSMCRAYLKRRRFPTLVRAEERFLRELRALRLDPSVTITPPSYFEGGRYTLRMTFKDLEDFHNACQTLNAIAKRPALKRLLEPY
jgi:ParB/RepB/Spo0J family partition protein